MPEATFIKIADLLLPALKITSTLSVSDDTTSTRTFLMLPIQNHKSVGAVFGCVVNQMPDKWSTSALGICHVA